MPRLAMPKIEYRPRKNVWVVIYRGKKIDECKLRCGCEAFVKGFMDAMEQRNAKQAERDSVTITDHDRAVFADMPRISSEQIRRNNVRQEMFGTLVNHPTNPLTREDLARLIRRNPELWNQFADYVERLPSRKRCNGKHCRGRK